MHCLSLLDARSLGAFGCVAGGRRLTESIDQTAFRCAAHDDALWKALCTYEKWTSGDKQRTGAARGWRRVFREASEARMRVARFQLAMMAGQTARCMQGAGLNSSKSKFRALPILDETPFNFVPFMEKRLTEHCPKQKLDTADAPQPPLPPNNLHDARKTATFQNLSTATTSSATTIVTTNRQLSLRQGSCTWSVLRK